MRVCWRASVLYRLPEPRSTGHIEIALPPGAAINRLPLSDGLHRGIVAGIVESRGVWRHCPVFLGKLFSNHDRLTGCLGRCGAQLIAGRSRWRRGVMRRRLERSMLACPATLLQTRSLETRLLEANVGGHGYSRPFQTDTRGGSGQVRPSQAHAVEPRAYGPARCSRSSSEVGNTSSFGAGQVQRVNYTIQPNL